MTINRPPADLFSLTADPESQVRWDRAGLRSIEKLTPGSLGTGSRYRGKLARYGTVEYELVEFEPPRRFVRGTHLRFGDLHHVFEFEEVPEGTRLTQRMQLEPHGVGRILALLVKPVLRKRMRVIDQELKDYSGTLPQGATRQASGVPSLYDRLGGVYNIATVVDDFIDRIMVDPRLNANPRVAEAHHRILPPGFKYLVTEMVCWAAGGPQRYSGHSMSDAHRDLWISEAEWQAFMDDLQQTLDKFQVPQAEQTELKTIVESTRETIVVTPVQQEGNGND